MTRVAVSFLPLFMMFMLPAAFAAEPEHSHLGHAHETKGATIVAPDSLAIEISGRLKVVRAADLKHLRRTTARGSIHGGPVRTFSGIPLGDILVLAGAAVHDSKGPALAHTLIVEAVDGYRVVFAIAEVDSTLKSRTVMLADRADGKPLPPDEGPWRMVVEGEGRPARWVKQVVAIRLRD